VRVVSSGLLFPLRLIRKKMGVPATSTSTSEELSHASVIYRGRSDYILITPTSLNINISSLITSVNARVEFLGAVS
jgi:hypothetical protein